MLRLSSCCIPSPLAISLPLLVTFTVSFLLFFRLFVRRRIFGLLRAFKVFHIVFPGALVVLQRQLGMT